jgi:hypothetical protein
MAPDIKVIGKIYIIMLNIGEALKKNHTILGIHLMGNEAKVDEMGFVSPEKDQDIAKHHFFTRIPCKNLFNQLYRGVKNRSYKKQEPY